MWIKLFRKLSNIIGITVCIAIICVIIIIRVSVLYIDNITHTRKDDELKQLQSIEFTAYGEDTLAKYEIIALDTDTMEFKVTEDSTTTNFYMPYSRKGDTLFIKDFGRLKDIFPYEQLLFNKEKLLYLMDKNSKYDTNYFMTVKYWK